MTFESPVLAAVLWAAIEEDSGLWEYPGEVAGAMARPRGVVRPEDFVIARAALILCVADGLVLLLRFADAHGSSVRICPTGEAMSVLSAEDSWTLPQPASIGWRVRATPRGALAYQRLFVGWDAPSLSRRGLNELRP
jgi:hypothetical protein